MAASAFSCAIRPYRPEDRENLKALCAETWPDLSPEAFERRWWWRSPSPPLKIAADEKTGEITGFCAYIPFAADDGRRVRSSAWLVDFFVSPRRQGQGIGRRLVESVNREFEIVASLNQSDAAYALFSRLGWAERRRIKLHLNFWPLLPGAVRLLAAGETDANFQLRGAPFPSGHLGLEFDRLWDDARGRFGLSSVRSSRSLLERFGWPGNPYRLLRCERKGTLAGYMITRRLAGGAVRSLRGLPAGLIVDYLTAQEGAAQIFSALLAESARQLAGEGPAVILALSSVPAFGRELAKLGFVHSESQLIGKALSRLDVGFTITAASGGEAIAAAPWFLTLGDCDMDLMW